MHILAATFKDVEGVKYFVASNKTALRKLRRDATDYRLWNAGWVDSKHADSWRTIGTHVVGEFAQVVL